jgi:hypothetical protein
MGNVTTSSGKGERDHRRVRAEGYAAAYHPGAGEEWGNPRVPSRATPFCTGGSLVHAGVREYVAADTNAGTKVLTDQQLTSWCIVVLDVDTSATALPSVTDEGKMKPVIAEAAPIPVEINGQEFVARAFNLSSEGGRLVTCCKPSVGSLIRIGRMTASVVDHFRGVIVIKFVDIEE